MVDLFSFETAHHFDDALPASLKLRHRIFVKRQGYNVSTYRGMEFDAFDTPAARYMLWRDTHAVPRAVTRLIPTDRPYMLLDIWPSLVETGSLPRSKTVWEVSRFGIDLAVPVRERKRALAEMMCGLAEFTARFAVSELLFVSQIGVVRRLVRKVSTVQRMGEDKKLGRHAVCAARVPIPDDIVRKMRAAYSLNNRSVLRGRGT